MTHRLWKDLRPLCGYIFFSLSVFGERNISNLSLFLYVLYIVPFTITYNMSYFVLFPILHDSPDIKTYPNNPLVY